MKVLVLNSGSSSQKVCLFDLAKILPDDPPGCLWEAKIEWDGESAAIAIKNSDGEVQRPQVPISSRGEALKHLLGNLWNGRERLLSQSTDIDLVGHRVVHGGPEYEEPMLITPEVRARIAGASAFAPLPWTPRLRLMIRRSLARALETKTRKRRLNGCATKIFAVKWPV